jgi:hypothetical protein
MDEPSAPGPASWLAEISDETADAIVTRLGQRLAESGHYDAFMAGVPEQERALIEDSFERHAARRRELGEPGW